MVGASHENLCDLFLFYYFVHYYYDKIIIIT